MAFTGPEEKHAAQEAIWVAERLCRGGKMSPEECVKAVRGAESAAWAVSAAESAAKGTRLLCDWDRAQKAAEAVIKLARAATLVARLAEAEFAAAPSDIVASAVEEAAAFANQVLSERDREPFGIRSRAAADYRRLLELRLGTYPSLGKPVDPVCIRPADQPSRKVSSDSLGQPSERQKSSNPQTKPQEPRSREPRMPITPPTSRQEGRSSGVRDVIIPPTNREKWLWLLVFAIAALSACAVGFLATAAIPVIDARFAITFVGLAIVIAHFAWVAAPTDGSRRRSIFVVLFFVFLVLAMPTQVVVTYHEAPAPPWLFWLTLSTWLLWVACFFFVTMDLRCDSWERFLLLIGTIWTVTALLGRLGSVGHWRFSERPIIELPLLQGVLDSRILFGTLFVVVSFVLSVVRAAKAHAPKVPAILLGRLPSASGRLPPFWGSLLDPFVIVANGMIAACNTILDVLWMALAITSVFFYRIGRELCRLMLQICHEGLGFMLRTVLTLVAVFAIAGVLDQAAPTALGYLRSATLWHSSELLIFLAGWSSLVLLCETGVIFLVGYPDREELRRSYLPDLFTAVAWSLAVLLVSGFPLYVIARLATGQIVGFDLPGPFTIALLLLVSFGFVVLLLKQPQSEER